MNRELVKSTSIFFYALVVLVIGAAVVVVRPFFTTIILAFLTVLIFRKPYYQILRVVGGRKGVATFLTILLVFALLIIPTALLASLIISQSITFITEIQDLVRNDPAYIRTVIQNVNLFLADLPLPIGTVDQGEVLEAIRNIIQPAGSFLLRNIASLGGQTLQFVTATVTYIMLLFSLFPNMQKLKRFLLRISPFDEETNLLYLRRTIAICESMVVGTVIIAVIQGLAAALILWIANIPYVMFWFMVYVFLSIIPLGGGIIMFPMGLFLLLTGQIWQGSLVLLSQILVIGNIDNILRPRIVSREIMMDPAILLIGVLGGVSVFGFFGIIYGPVILIFLQTTIEIYLKHYQIQGRKRV